MAHTHATELLQAVRSFLREQLLPTLDGFAAYTTRVSANSLAIVIRELEQRERIAELDSAAARRWQLCGDAQGEISRALKKGDMAVTPELIDYLRARCLQQIAIDNPRYSGYADGCRRWPRLAPGAQRRPEQDPSPQTQA